MSLADDWLRIEVPAERIRRIPAAFLAKERRSGDPGWYRQEYGCLFEALEGLVYPDFARCVVPALPDDLKNVDPKLRLDVHDKSYGLRATDLQRVGGIDFGFRNPFAALWGLIDRDGVLWLTGEHYCRGQPLSYHIQYLPQEVTWYADPSGASEISELNHADFTVRRGDNALTFGIQAVSARLRSGLLKVVEGRCPNLLAEAGLYRYGESTERGTEAPMDEHNHALAALRYLISRLDARKLVRPRPAAPALKPLTPEELEEQKRREKEERYRRMVEDDRYWTELP